MLGRARTGDETYVPNLLRALAPLAPEAELRFAAVTRHPELVPDGVEAIELRRARRSCAWPGRCRACCAGSEPELGHFQHALPLGCRGRAVVTMHDLSFERDPSLMGRIDRARLQDDRPARGAAGGARARRSRSGRAATCVELYGSPDERIA